MHHSQVNQLMVARTLYKDISREDEILISQKLQDIAPYIKDEADFYVSFRFVLDNLPLVKSFQKQHHLGLYVILSLAGKDPKVAIHTFSFLSHFFDPLSSLETAKQIKKMMDAGFLNNKTSNNINKVIVWAIPEPRANLYYSGPRNLENIFNQMDFWVNTNGVAVENAAEQIATYALKPDAHELRNVAH